MNDLERALARLADDEFRTEVLRDEAAALREYHLTEAGQELRPILLSLAQWGERWTGQHGARWIHTCGHELELTHTCAACGGEVTGLDLRVKRPAAAA